MHTVSRKQQYTLRSNNVRMAVHCFLLKVQARQSPGRGAHFVSTFKVEYMSVLDWKKLVETGVWFEHKLLTYLEHAQNISRARSKYTSRTAEHGRNIPRARSKHTSSTVETYLEHGRNIPRARSKNTDCSAVIQSQKEKNESNIVVLLKQFRLKLLFTFPNDGKK